MASGYTDCACRDCFDIAVSNDMDSPDLCNECETAGCDPEGECECERCNDGSCSHDDCVQDEDNSQDEDDNA